MPLILPGGEGLDASGTEFGRDTPVHQGNTMQQHISLKNSKYRKQAGLTLLELSIGLGIVLAIAALAIGIGTTTSATQRSADAQTQLLQIAAAARQAGINGSYEGVTAAVLARTDKVPVAWVGGTPAAPILNNPFGGQYTLLPQNVDAAGVEAACTPGGPCNGLRITATALPPSACSSMISNASANFPIIREAAVDIKNDRAATPPAFNADTISTRCQEEQNDISFVTVG